MPPINPYILLYGEVKEHEKMLHSLIAHKHIGWEYEKEWRILHIKKYLPYVYDTNALKSVYFGKEYIPNKDSK